MVDPQLRRRLDAATMANRDLLRQQRVAAGTKDTRRAAGKVCDWAVEAHSVATSQPYTYGVPIEGGDDITRQARVANLATHESRHARISPRTKLATLRSAAQFPLRTTRRMAPFATRANLRGLAHATDC